MNDFIATLGPGRVSNWRICKSECLWGVVGKGTNWRKNLESVRGGDRIFIWRSGPPKNGFIAEIEAMGCAEFVNPSTRIPWPNPDSFGGVFPIKVVLERDPPLSDRFPNETRRVGLRYGFNNTVLQHSFEEIPVGVAEKIAADLRDPAPRRR